MESGLGELKIMNGYLITIEGFDGVGKTTAAENVRRELNRKGFDSVVFKGLDKNYLNTRALLRTASGELTQKVNALMSMHRHSFMYETEILPALKSGLVVVSDRGLMSLKYKLMSRGRDDLVLPDYSYSPQKIFLLKVDAEIAHSRITSKRALRRAETGYKRAKSTDAEKEFIKYHALFYEFAEKTCPNHIHINGMKKIDEVTKDVLSQLLADENLLLIRSRIDFSKLDDAVIFNMCMSEESVNKARAIAELGYRNKEKELIGIYDAIKISQDELVLRNYLESLRRVKCPISIDRLLIFLENERAHVRQAAGNCLEHISEEEKFEQLINLSKDTDKDVRLVATKQLSKYNSEEIIDALHKNKNENPYLISTLVSALSVKDCSNNQIKEICKLLRNEFNAISTARFLRKQPGNVSDAILSELIFHFSDDARREFLLSVADDALPEYPVNELFSKAKNSFEKICALEYCGAAQLIEASEYVAQLTQCTDWQVAKTAVETLLGMEQYELIPESFRKHPDFNIRRKIASHEKNT